MRWCEREKISETIKAIEPGAAMRFLDALPAFAGPMEDATVKKYRNRLAVYSA